MIRAYRNDDLSTVMQIWLDANIKTHNFIAVEYWVRNYDMVKDMLPKSELYIHEDDYTNCIDGFIGLKENHIEGIFVADKFQSNGIGKQLLDYVKKFKESLTLNVYQKNERAIRFYNREEFFIQCEEIDDDTNEAEFVMTWRQ